ncbi:hypothetical protein PCANC_15490 [Puccinia coronata f. sp. avenae]|uniref:Uncharacterized protein n=1 Tax=Puccinia coronata f. sp. avenae TaxID=200324 RepID=A0A2N5UFU4_9BASI|nr:hypothetical protein PCANC_15490 [Puccinia coronata f. sp. avenae]
MSVSVGYGVSSRRCYPTYPTGYFSPKKSPRSDRPGRILGAPEAPSKSDNNPAGLLICRSGSQTWDSYPV